MGPPLQGKPKVKEQQRFHLQRNPISGSDPRLCPQIPPLHPKMPNHLDQTSGDRGMEGLEQNIRCEIPFTSHETLGKSLSNLFLTCQLREPYLKGM